MSDLRKVDLSKLPPIRTRMPGIMAQAGAVMARMEVGEAWDAPDGSKPATLRVCVYRANKTAGNGQFRLIGKRYFDPSFTSYRDIWSIVRFA